MLISCPPAMNGWPLTDDIILAHGFTKRGDVFERNGYVIRVGTSGRYISNKGIVLNLTSNLKGNYFYDTGERLPYIAINKPL